jgi:SRSO17 transposase
MALSIPTIPQELLRTTRVRPSQVEGMPERLNAFAASFAPFFWRKEQRHLSKMFLGGLLSDLPRKSVEPIAIAREHPRQGLQRFVGEGNWEDARVRGELHRQVAPEMGDPDGILVLDSSGFPKKGTHSVGVARQWCGRLGKEENCQVGVYVSYVGRGSYTLLDGELYLPHEWTRSRRRLDRCHVPQKIGFRTKTKIADDLLRVVAPRLPHGWIVGDDEFGRPAHFRRALRRRAERYLLEVPSNTLIRDLEAPRPERRFDRRGRLPQTPFLNVASWTKARPGSSWTRVGVRNGEKGPIQVQITTARVRARATRKPGPPELLIVTRTLARDPEVRYYLSNAEATTPREILARVAGARHRIEENFEISKGDIGMHQYEVRSWVGWHHHMTLAFLAHWFLTLEHRRLGEKISGPDGGLDGPAVSNPAA